MGTHGHTTINHPTDEWSPAPAMDRGRRFVQAVTLLAGKHPLLLACWCR